MAKDTEETKSQIIEIISKYQYQDTSNIWINKLGTEMIASYGKSKTNFWSALKALIKSGIVEKYQDKTADRPNRKYLRIVKTTESELVKNHEKSLESTRKYFKDGLRYLKKHGMFDVFRLNYEHITKYKKDTYCFINDKPTWKKGEKVSNFNNPEFLKSKLIRTEPKWFDVGFKPKSRKTFLAILNSIDSLYNYSNKLQIGMTLGHFDKLYDQTIKSQYKQSLKIIGDLITKLLELFPDPLEKEYIDQLIKDRFSWQISLDEIKK